MRNTGFRNHQISEIINTLQSETLRTAAEPQNQRGSSSPFQIETLFRECKSEKLKPINTAGEDREIAEDQVNGGRVWLKKRDQKFGLNTEMEGPMNNHESGRAENEAVMLD